MDMNRKVANSLDRVKLKSAIERIIPVRFLLRPNFFGGSARVLLVGTRFIGGLLVRYIAALLFRATLQVERLA